MINDIVFSLIELINNLTSSEIDVKIDMDGKHAKLQIWTDLEEIKDE